MTWGGRCEEALAELDIVVHGQSVAPAYGYYWEALGESFYSTFDDIKRQSMLLANQTGQTIGVRL